MYIIKRHESSPTLFYILYYYIRLYKVLSIIFDYVRRLLYKLHNIIAHTCGDGPPYLPMCTLKSIISKSVEDYKQYKLKANKMDGAMGGGILKEYIYVINLSW